MVARKEWGRLVAGILALGWAAAGCGGQQGIAGSTYNDPHPLPPDTMLVQVEQPGRYGGRFVIGQTNPPKTFNHISANETSSTDITTRLYAGLADYDHATQSDYPQLAKSIDVSPDQLTYTFHLRRGAAFSDGHPITSDDVLFCFEVCYDEKLHPSIQDLLKMDGKKFEVTAPDSYTVVIRIPKPNALLIAIVGSVRIMPKHVLEPFFRRGEFASAFNVSTSPDSIVTSGPWRVKQFVPGEKVVLARNPYWFGVDQEGQRMPYLDEVVFLVVADQDAAMLKFEAGELDAIDNVKPENYKSLGDNQKQGAYTLYDLGPALNTNFFWFNLNKVHPPSSPEERTRIARAGKKVGESQVDPVKFAWFKEPDFRRAISMAVDRDAIIRSVLFGDAVKNWSTSTQGNKEWFTPEATGFDFNPEQAKKLLAGLGMKDTNGDGILEDKNGHTVSFTLKTNGDNTMRMAMCNLIKDDLAKVGVRCLPSGVDFNTLIVNFREDFQYEAALLGLQSGVPPDPGMGQNVWRSSGLTHYWHIKQPTPDTPQEAEIDRLMDQNLSTNDPAVRHQTWTAIQKTVNDQCWVIWLPTIIAKVPIRDKFGNLQPSVIPHRIIWNVERVYQKSGAAKPA